MSEKLIRKTKSIKNTAFYKFFAKIFSKWRPSSELSLLATALMVGIATGLGAVLFRYLIQAITNFSYGTIPELFQSLGKSYVLFVPAIGGLIVGSLVYFFAREAKGHGVPEVIEAIALKGGRIRPRVAIVKSLASSVCIGSGGSVGREGPIVQIGSAIGSTIGQKLNMSEERVSNLVACGAASGIAATFNAPIAGVVFALEVILGGFSIKHLNSVVIAAVSASVIGRMAFGDVPAFAIPFKYGIVSIWEFAFYALLGIIAAFAGVIYTRSIYWTEDLFDNWKAFPEWGKPAIGGFLLGAIALLYPILIPIRELAWDKMPHVFGVGYEMIDAALANHIILPMAIALLILKLLATNITIGSGGSGGVFAPSLFLGAMLGVAFELVINAIFPNITAPPGAYALVGMAALFSASAHAPITAVLILFELTGDYNIILPLMLTVVVATLLSNRLLNGESIYSLKLSRRGIKLQHGRDVNILQSVLISEVLDNQVDTISKNTKLTELADALAHSHHNGFGVLDDEGKLFGIVTFSDLERALHNGMSEDTSVAEIATTWPHLKVAYPDESIDQALEKMSEHGLGRLPIVSREDPYILLGILWRKDIIQAYDLALKRKTRIEVSTRAIDKNADDSTEFIDIHLTKNDKVIGQTIAKTAQTFPKDCVLVSIKRNGRVIIPHGDTTFKNGDVVTALVKVEEAPKLFKCLHG